ncbi:MAG: KpsF/GutQ family sugar-phosphate isomerase [Planctomycetota bacterium]
MSLSARRFLDQTPDQNDDPFVVDDHSLSTFEQMRTAGDVIRAEANALESLANSVPVDFCDAVELILRCNGCVIVTGVGKAGWIGQKVSASFASTGTPSHFLHPAEAFHGDLGRVGPHDLILVFSNSGETSEVSQLLPSFENFGTPIISITGNPDSTLASKSTATLCYGKTQEVCHLGLAPTTSTTLMLAMGDALTLVVSKSRRFSAAKFAKFHPGGSLGKKLSNVEDIMRPISECRLAVETETVREIYVRSGGTARRAGVVLVTNDQGVLTGLFTDSDLARLLGRQQDNQFDSPIRDVMTQSPITIKMGSKTVVAIETLACRNLSELPVVDENGTAVGLIDITDVVSYS